MTDKELFAFFADLPAAPDCTMLLWAPIHWDAIAQKLIAHAGFEYKSMTGWAKRQSLGRWFRARNENLLLAVGGKSVCPVPGDNWPSLVEAEAPSGRRRHSEKPESSGT
jgi:N6-adenosine-specific RNA methylase IME4